MDLPWLRWWDSQGNLLLTAERARPKVATENARQATERVQRLAARLRELGIDPDQV